MSKADNSLEVSGWDGSDMTQELSHILLCFGGYNINDADGFDFEELDSALNVAIMIYMSAKEKNLKASAFKVAEMLEFLKNGYCGYARSQLNDAISQNLDELNNCFEQEFRDFFKNKFNEFGYAGLRTVQTFNSYMGNILYSKELKCFAMTSSNDKAAAFLAFAQSFNNQAFDYMDAMVSASEMGAYSTVEEYFNFLIDNEAENKQLMKRFLANKDFCVDYLSVDNEILELLR